VVKPQLVVLSTVQVVVSVNLTERTLSSGYTNDCVAKFRAYPTINVAEIECTIILNNFDGK
jgi:hypothetical protein